ncbi:hypothetical protein PV05_04230 [Exophiala xenobiotica]|uniref:DUF6594 domain-containing protein n=1 Tax=Exophiala xenobiotica TaxID=348802 RepID=A0A0D2BSP6_9EURO|nr:uncharacterized protein PV05_04230 [Exophiala xenobiotica]KIW55491.1 hypothetical protein PV05_04230 [Exophiala xenobiotica]
MTGYTVLAKLIGIFPELNIYRRFGASSAGMLLFEQAELAHREAELRDITAELQTWPDMSLIDQSWSKLNEAEDESASGYLRDKTLEFHAKLRQYQEDLLRIKELHKTRSPAERSLSFLRRWLRGPGRGDDFLEGYEADPWAAGREGDLVGLYDEQSDDLLAGALSKLGSIWHRFVGYRSRPTTDIEDGVGRIWKYEHRHFVLLGNLICVVVSTAVPTASTLILFYVDDMVRRLQLMAVFVLVLAFVMMFMLHCQRVEVILATASFAAVQVVFLQGVNGTRGSC